MCWIHSQRRGQYQTPFIPCSIVLVTPPEATRARSRLPCPSRNNIYLLTVGPDHGGATVLAPVCSCLLGYRICVCHGRMTRMGALQRNTQRDYERTWKRVITFLDERCLALGDDSLFEFLRAEHDRGSSHSSARKILSAVRHHTGSCAPWPASESYLRRWGESKLQS